MMVTVWMTNGFQSLFLNRMITVRTVITKKKPNTNNHSKGIRNGVNISTISHSKSLYKTTKMLLTKAKKSNRLCYTLFPLSELSSFLSLIVQIKTTACSVSAIKKLYSLFKNKAPDSGITQIIETASKASK
ncbi:hypothetical protein [Priestia abyssalis]|uniref:hypothetical protein n=1 Tax=Priestia abyssalis TaxID=1221450 RepID=UPI001474B07A|nr:hypothetical protein [Priestia abyssalis]